MTDSNVQMNICLLLESGSGHTSTHFLAATYFVMATNIFINVALLYLFNRGLWMLRQETLLMILNERIKSHSDDTVHGLEGDQCANPDINRCDSMKNDTLNAMDTMGTVQTPSGSPKLSIENPEKEIERMSTSKKSILRLHNLIKKQTILVCIAVLSTTGLAVISTLDAAGIAVCGWDVVVNALCVWLMLGLSKEYWYCCSRYGLCHICYLHDEQNRMMMMIERTPTSLRLGRSPTSTQLSSARSTK